MRPEPATQGITTFHSLTCPLPITDYDAVLLGHGSGGRLSSRLLHDVFLPAFDNPLLAPLDDQAVLDVEGTRLAFTTDAFVVDPLFFPGGNIGHLAVNGTINDLCVGGAHPLYISAAFILEEGFRVDDLRQIVLSMRQAADAAGVHVVTGDTKVVNRGCADKLFITTSGVGEIQGGRYIRASNARPGDQILLSGTVGDHGMAIMSCRENLEFETSLESDTAALNGLVEAMLDAHPSIHCMRDPTRGGLASTLNEIASHSKVGMVIDEKQIPIHAEVKGACEILGLDPLYVANEGKLVAFVAPEAAAAVLDAMCAHPLGQNAQRIGEVVGEHPGMVWMRTEVGGTRVVDLLMGEQLPRIC